MPPLPIFRSTRKLFARTVPGASSWLMRARPAARRASERAPQTPGPAVLGRGGVVVRGRDPDAEADGRQQPAGAVEHVRQGVEPLDLVRGARAHAGHGAAR